jgi:CubicO group peptidase (beta-lactamase class C family)
MGFDIQKLNRVDDMAQSYIDNGLLPGAMYAVVRAEGVVHTSSVGGYRQDQTFRIFSMTKPITIVAALTLFEEGKLLLTDPVAHYLPEHSAPQVMQGDGTLRPARTTMTIRDLMTQTAGFTYSGNPSKVSEMYGEARIWDVRSLDAFSRRAAQLPLVADPGSFWRYSISLDILGRIIEVISGQTLDAFYAERIFEPLKMTDTAFTSSRDRLERLAPLFEYKEGGMDPADPAADDYYESPNFPSAGGGLISTLPDYIRFARMLLGDGALEGTRILSRKTVDLMMADHILAMNPDLKAAEPWLGRTENRNGTSHSLGFGYGLGAAIIRSPALNGVPGSAGTYGWGGNANTYLFVDRTEDVSGIFFTQLRPSGTYPVRAQFRAMIYQAMD